MKIRTVYQVVCHTLLEPNGLTGTWGVADADFLAFVADSIRSFLQETGILVDFEVIQAAASTTRYEPQAVALRPQEVFYDLEALEWTTAGSMPRGVNWQDEVDRPKYWHEDRVEQGKFEVMPAPSYSGAAPGAPPALSDGADNLLLFESVLPDLSALTLDSEITQIPRTFGWYIAYGVLWRIFSGDTLMKDGMRAAYAKARFDEGVAVAKEIMREI